MRSTFTDSVRWSGWLSNPPVYKHTSPFEYLVLDVLEYILSLLSASDLVSLASVSRRCNRAATPALYTHISLLLRIYKAHGDLPGQTTNHATLRTAQRIFMATVTARPELALHVRTLEWFFQPLYPEIRVLWGARKDAVTINALFIQFMPKFLKVKKIHLVSPTTGSPSVSKTTLFPYVSSIKLVNLTSITLAKSIIHSPSQLAELSLDESYSFSNETDMGMLQWLTASLPLPALQRLSLRWPASATVYHDGPFPHRHTSILLAWKQILAGSRITLRHILLGFKNPRMHLQPHVASSLEIKFLEVVGPVFMDMDWPELSILELEGVSTSPRLYERLEAAVPRLILYHRQKTFTEMWNHEILGKF